eukprot:COSAG06_NODE_60298_length_271_cov_0.790698_1_plen_29_part_10
MPPAPPPQARQGSAGNLRKRNGADGAILS